MTEFALTPQAPYYAVIFTSLRTEGDNGYGEMSEKMVNLAAAQPGFLGMESVRNGLGITVSYWDNLEAIRAWHRHAEHELAQKAGYQKWYKAFKVRVCKVERDYDFERSG
jgi:heme-degrading monooxygenase HmoA